MEGNFNNSGFPKCKFGIETREKVVSLEKTLSTFEARTSERLKNGITRFNQIDSRLHDLEEGMRELNNKLMDEIKKLYYMLLVAAASLVMNLLATLFTFLKH